MCVRPGLSGRHCFHGVIHHLWVLQPSSSSSSSSSP
ncbi:rCG24248 [Rattus norvegicus]|uniref:RCG24248 n=1 Tax=Rattus norvegicus TaxID=10116 RepID=A6KAI8_RAT|nr:rCG24248 [Rattus norvegicus]